MFIQLTGTVTHNSVDWVWHQVHTYSHASLHQWTIQWSISHMHLLLFFICSYFHYYTVSQKKMHQLWNGITQKL